VTPAFQAISLLFPQLTKSNNSNLRGKKMKKYWISEFSNKQAYDSFIEYMLLNSEYFSFVYFGYGTNPKMKAGLREIKNDLQKYQVHSQKTLNMPGMITLDTNNTYRIAIYRSTPEVYNVLTKEKDIFDWDYPDRPMDLAFFRDGYAWFISVSHEMYAYFITDNEDEIEHLKSLGVNIIDVDDTREGSIFRWKPGEKVPPLDIHRFDY